MPDALCVANTSANTVSFASSAAITATIAVGAGPTMCAVDPRGMKAYVTDTTAGTVSVVDVPSRTVTATIAVGSGPTAAVFSPDGARAYVTNNVSNTVSVIDVAAGSVTATVAVGSAPVGAAVSPDGTKVYVADDAANTVSVIDAASLTVTAVAVGSGPTGVAFAPDGSKAYVTDSGSAKLSVIDVASGTVTATFFAGSTAYSVAVSPDGTKAYVTDIGAVDTVLAIDLTTGAVTATIRNQARPEGVAFSPDGARVYVADWTGGTVSVIDPATAAVTATITGFTRPGLLSVFPADPCPCSVFPPSATPAVPDGGDGAAVEVGTKVRVTAPGRITGVRFYKSAANTGTHSGSLWSADGTLLATGTFANETATGWQTLTFANPVPVKPGTTYVASYHAPNGHYAADNGFFAGGGAGTGPITALADGADGGNGVYAYGSASTFPSSTYDATDFGVDAVYDAVEIPDTPPKAVLSGPGPGATDVDSTTTVTVGFNAPLDPATVTYTLTDSAGRVVPTSRSSDSSGQSAILTPATQLALGAVFTASIQASDVWGNAMPVPFTWTFTTGTTPPAYTCPCTLIDPAAVPAVTDSGDANAVELGVRFTPAVDGTVTGVRFYKGASNTGVHTGSLWAVDGTQLATGTFTGETATGWQTLTFARPIAVTAGTAYVVSYHAPNGGYSYTTGYFAYPRTNYPLTAATDNGLYAYSAATGFPTGAGGGANYWVDPVFMPTAP